MKQTHDFDYQKQEEITQLTSLLSTRALLTEKARINLYLPKAVIKLMNWLAKDKSRGELISSLILKEAQQKENLPYGMFSGIEISEKEIKKITHQLDKTVNELT